MNSPADEFLFPPAAGDENRVFRDGERGTEVGDLSSLFL